VGLGIDHQARSFTQATFRDTLPTMAETKYRCQQCDKEELRCDCDKYCCLCEGLDGTRMCADGLYYCKDCREACGYATEGE
jgi:hypothetical protein